MELPADILDYVRRDFAEAEISEVLSLLENAKIHDGSEAEPRLLRCALASSKNTISGLRYQIDGLAHDYRDVILDAEYTRRKVNGFRFVIYRNHLNKTPNNALKLGPPNRFAVFCGPLS